MSIPSIDQHFEGGTHHHYYYNLTQKELDLETKEPCTFRISPALLEYVSKRAEKAGIPRSKYIESIIKKYFQSEPHLKKIYRVLDQVIEKNF